MLLTIARSRAGIAESSSRPNPGRTKTVSVSTAPEIMRPTCAPMTVTTGSNALRSACLPTTARPRRPLATAVRTQSWPSTSMRLGRATRAIGARNGTVSAVTGRSMCRATSSAPASPWASTRTSRIPCTGNASSRYAMTSSSFASQKTGTA